MMFQLSLIASAGLIDGLTGMTCEVGCGSFGLGTALVCRVFIKMMAATMMTRIATANATTTGRNDESLLRFSGVGSLLDGAG
jgi:hypothetical protein